MNVRLYILHLLHTSPDILSVYLSVCVCVKDTYNMQSVQSEICYSILSKLKFAGEGDILYYT